MWRSVAVALVLALVSLAAGQRSVETIDLAGSRYFISQTSPYVPTLNWFLAYQYCRTIGMELLTIATAEEAQVISSYLAENRLTDTDYWTGGNQLGSHLWMWMATGQRFNSSFDNWAPEQAFVRPSDASCMSVNNGGWVPQNCRDEKYFICELTRCFFVNFVSASRGSSQGLPVTPRITGQGNTPPHRSAPQHHHNRQRQQRPPTPKIDPLKTTRPPPQPASRHTATIPSQPPRVTASKTPSLTPTTLKQGTLPTTQMPLKTMPTAPPEDQFEEVTTISQPGRLKVMPGSHRDSDSAVHNNEIFQSGFISPLRLLQPPTKEFSFSSPFISSSIPLQAEASTNFTNEQPHSRKETFSWALLQGRSK